MRNLKKVLALVLALVMSLSLVTIANATDFSDDADIDYEEAVDVMSAIGVIDGIGNNKFDPDGTLTREQAAKLITYMLMGSNADKLGVESTSFKDVAATRWSAPAIEYCATLGIIDGAGDGNFYPAGKLTGYAFAKMLLTAIGYDSKIEGFTGPSWTINVATMGMDAGLHKGLENMFGSAELSRQEAAQMALNCIKAPLVQYTNGTTVTVGGQEVSVGSSRWEYVTTTIARQQNISNRRLTNSSINAQNTGFTVEFGEKYFPNLRLVSESDAFERPSHTWVFENKELGTYVDYDLLVESYTTGVTHKALYDLLGRSNLEDYRFEYYVDGIRDTTLTANGTNAAQSILGRTTRDAGFSDNGVLTQVFVDHDFDEGTGLIRITSIRTWLGKVTTAYNENREEATVTVYADYTDGASSPISELPMNVGVVDVPNAVDLTEDKFVLVNMSGKDYLGASPTNYGNSSLWDVVKVSDPEILTDVALNEFSKRESDDDYDSDDTGHEHLFSSVTTSAGTKYDYSARAAYDENVLDLYNNTLLVNKTYNIYLDQYGYAIGIDLYSGNDNYVFITGFDGGNSALALSQADAGAIFLDGTMKTIKVNVKDTNKNIDKATDSTGKHGDDYFVEWNGTNFNSLNRQATVNRWFTYSENNGVYTLTPATRMMTTKANGMTATAAEIKCSNVVLDKNGNEGAGDGVFAHPASASDVRIYGNDDSVFLVAELGDTDNPDGQVITGVDGVYTGVQNVDITLHTTVNGAKDNRLVVDSKDTYLYDNTYSVYDRNGYIIASVVLGEVKGGNANYVFVLSAAKNEKLRDGKHYWDFDAVVDGAIKTLTVEDKFDNTINDLRPGHMQEVRYTGEYVSNIKDVSATAVFTDDWAGIGGTNPIDPKVHEIYEMGHVSYDGGNGPVYDSKGNAVWDTCTDNDHATYTGATGYDKRIDVQDLHLKGRTLYLAEGYDWGLTMASNNTPTVLIQDQGGKNDVKTAYADVRNALAAMQDAYPGTSGKGFKGRIAAALDGQGRAKWVVIISDTEVPVAGAGTPGTPAASFVGFNDTGYNTITFSAQTTFSLYQVLESGTEIFLSSYTTNASGVYTGLPTVNGRTYRVVWNNGTTVIADNN